MFKHRAGTSAIPDRRDIE